MLLQLLMITMTTAAPNSPSQQPLSPQFAVRIGCQPRDCLRISHALHQSGGRQFSSLPAMHAFCLFQFDENGFQLLYSYLASKVVTHHLNLTQTRSIITLAVTGALCQRRLLDNISYQLQSCIFQNVFLNHIISLSQVLRFGQHSVDHRE